MWWFWFGLWFCHLFDCMPQFNFFSFCTVVPGLDHLLLPRINPFALVGFGGATALTLADFLIDVKWVLGFSALRRSAIFKAHQDSVNVKNIENIRKKKERRKLKSKMDNYGKGKYRRYDLTLWNTKSANVLDTQSKVRNHPLLSACPSTHHHSLSLQPNSFVTSKVVLLMQLVMFALNSFLQ